MRYILMIIGSILGILFLLKLKEGEKYKNLVEVLDENDFPLNSLYIVGFAWSSVKLFQLKGKLAAELKSHAALLYEEKYSEYYANIAWAQTITLTHLFLTVTFLAAGIMYDSAVLLVGAGIFMSIIVAVYGLENMKNTLTSRTEECERQLPEVVSTIAILVNSGMVLREAWNMVGENGTGVFYELMRKASENMRNGYSDTDAIFLFGRESNSVEIKKFVNALLQSMEKSGSELPIFLANQSSELWNTKRQRMLQSGEKAAAKLLLPIVIIFIGIILIVITAAFGGSLF